MAAHLRRSIARDEASTARSTSCRARNRRAASIRLHGPAAVRARLDCYLRLPGGM